MLCRNPYVKGIEPYGCGQCMPCRINRRRIWSHRIMLESMLHKDSVFVTLTYSQENVPEGGTLVKKDLQDWLKRFRKAIAPVQIRYYAVGEYGERTERPHYHIILFGVGVLAESLILETWKKGLIHVGSVTLQSASYVTGYVTKKMTKDTDDRLDGRAPEFAIMSLKPGIGYGAVPDIAKVLNSEHGSKVIARDLDVPNGLKHGGKSMPLGRYMRSKLREECGFETTGGQSVAEVERKAELLAMRNDYSTPQAYEAARPFVEWDKSNRTIYRSKLFAKKGTI